MRELFTFANNFCINSRADLGYVAPEEFSHFLGCRGYSLGYLVVLDFLCELCLSCMIVLVFDKGNSYFCATYHFTPPIFLVAWPGGWVSNGVIDQLHWNIFLFFDLVGVNC